MKLSRITIIAYVLLVGSVAVLADRHAKNLLPTCSSIPTDYLHPKYHSPFLKVEVPDVCYHHGPIKNIEDFKEFNFAYCCHHQGLCYSECIDANQNSANLTDPLSVFPLNHLQPSNKLRCDQEFLGCMMDSCQFEKEAKECREIACQAFNALLDEEGYELYTNTIEAHCECWCDSEVQYYKLHHEPVAECEGDSFSLVPTQLSSSLLSDFLRPRSTDDSRTKSASSSLLKSIQPGLFMMMGSVWFFVILLISFTV